MTRMERLVFASLLSGLGLIAQSRAVAADAPTFVPATDLHDGEALVYVYRRFKLAGAAAPMGFSLDGEPVAALWAGRYTVLAIPAGHVVVWSLPVGTERVSCHQSAGDWFTEWFHDGVPYIQNTAWKRPIEFDVEAGQTYYVELQLGFRSKAQPESEAMPDLVKAKYVDPRAEVLAGTQQDAEEMASSVEQACGAGTTIESVSAAARLTKSRVPAH